LQRSWEPQIVSAIVDSFEVSPVASCVVEPNSRLLAANTAAQELLADGRGFALRDGYLAANDAIAEAKMRAALRGPRRRLVMARHGPRPADKVMALVTPRRNVGLVQFWRQSTLRISFLKSLADIYNLSASQARVAAEIACGRSVPRIARKMGISPDTVRSHLKSVFEKTGVHTQIGLAGLAARCGGFLP
jgi:DNA-binding CsgD family transcriptional regulator